MTEHTDTVLEAYCVRCREKRPLKDPEPVFTAGGRPATRGTCPACGTTLFRMGATPAHEGMDPPPPPNRRAGWSSWNPRQSPYRRPGSWVRATRSAPRWATSGTCCAPPCRWTWRTTSSPPTEVPREKKQVVKELAEEVKKAAEVYLATDPDREGEAIAWHLTEAVGIRPQQLRRVVFHEITQSAIEEAFAHPRGIDMNLVNAQQARRILDRLVGYSLSPLLWRKVRSRLSAGRVQSVAVRMVVEREREIQNFVPEEYWSIQAELAKREARRRTFLAKLHRIRGEEVNLKDEPATRAVVEELEGAVYVVASVKEGQRRRQPSPPFTTSTMQQEASRRLGFTATRTMRIAQQLYEGIDLDGSGPVGLITYMRTDSVNVAEQAQAEARQYIARRYGEDFLPPQPPVYKTKTKGAQEAHEAIRPTSVFREPEAIRDQLTRDQYRLYQLIWQRFVASQMPPALYDTMTVEIEAGPAEDAGRFDKPTYLFRATGSTLRFSGFLIVYEEAKDEDVQEEEPVQQIPPLTVGEVLDLVRLIPEQHFTQPPPRYTEATLVRALEEYGIGRPSTYAPILATIQQRGYVRREGKRLVPTETGFLVNDLLVEHFPEVMDYNFTAQMEEQLDEIAAGRQEWVPVVREFYRPFALQVARADQRIEKVELESAEVGRNCPECGAPLTVRWGRYGKFIGCSRFPECRYTEPWQEKVGATCPQCGGDLVEKRTRRGRTGYGCINYPACNFWVWQRPLPTPCPACGGLMTEARKGIARCIACGEEVAIEEEG